MPSRWGAWDLDTIESIPTADIPDPAPTESFWRYWAGEFSVYGPALGQAAIDRITTALVAAVEAELAFVGGGFAETDSTGNGPNEPA